MCKVLRQVLQRGSACGNSTSAALWRRQRCRLLGQRCVHTTAQRALLSGRLLWLDCHLPQFSCCCAQLRVSFVAASCSCYLRISAASLLLRETLSGMSCLSTGVTSLLIGKDACFPRQWRVEPDMAVQLNPLQ